MKSQKVCASVLLSVLFCGVIEQSFEFTHGDDAGHRESWMRPVDLVRVEHLHPEREPFRTLTTDYVMALAGSVVSPSRLNRGL
jgi:hypothetical protein